MHTCGQQRLWPGHRGPYLLLGAVLEQLFEVVSDGREQHGFVGVDVAAHVDAAQAMLVNRVPEHGPPDRTLGNPTLARIAPGYQLKQQSHLPAPHPAELTHDPKGLWR